MPGHNPAEAVRNYIDPLQRAASCLKGTAKILVSGRVTKIGDEGAWMLNGPTGMELPRFGRLRAQQRFKLIDSDPMRFDQSLGKYRITTLMYAYAIEMNSGETIQWHWHPDGNSPEHRPHIHPSLNPKAHMPGPRFMFEEIVEGCIQLGAAPAFDGWQQRLLETGGIHRLYRTWTYDPSERRTD